MTGDFVITVAVDEERMKRLEESGLAEQVKEVQGKRVLQVPGTKKDQKKLLKTFPDLQFDPTNACELPKEAEEMLFNMVCELKTIDVMKVYVMKAFNPLAGKEPRRKVF